MSKKRRGRGEGSIYPRKDGSWVGSLSLGYDAEGKRIREDVYGATKKEVQEKLTELQRNFLDGNLLKKEKITVHQHFDDWLRAKKFSVEDTTHSSYKTVYEKHIKPTLGGLQLKKLTYAHINKLYEALKEKALGKRMLGYVSFLLRSALEDAVRKGLVSNNQAKLSAQQSRKQKEARFLNQEEVRAFIKAARGERFECGFLLALHTGCRPGEWLGLSWDAVDWKNQTIKIYQGLREYEGKLYITKDLKTEAAYRTISLSASAMAILKKRRKEQAQEQLICKDWKNEHNLVFTNTKGGLPRRSDIGKGPLKRITEKAGLKDVTLHTLRHTHASILIFQKVDIKTISRRLGHEDVGFTLQVYGHLLPGQDEGAAEEVTTFLNSL